MTDDIKHKNTIVDYYNKESTQYSKKRYEGSLNTYTQYLFRKRMEIYFNYISDIKNTLKHQIELFDIGCADGVVLFNTENKFSDFIKSFDAVDVSSSMVDIANKNKINNKFNFYLRGQEIDKKYDLVTELGVHISDPDSEYKYVKDKLNGNNSFYIFSVSSKNSLHTIFKLKNDSKAKHYTDLKTFKQTEIILSKYFKIIKKTPYGLFIPKLWSISRLGSLFQPIIDTIFSFITPSLFHETIYLVSPLDKKE
jgi:SAM-dependent methyltransferase